MDTDIAEKIVKIVSSLSVEAQRKALEYIELLEREQTSDEETASKIKDSLRGRVFSDSAALLRADRRR